MSAEQPAQLSPVRLAMFDSDGTLADTLPWMRGIFNELADEYGFRKVAPHEQERFKNLHGAALLRELRLPLWKLPRVVNGMRRRMADHTGKFSLFEGMGDALQALARAGIKLAVVSSNSRENVERILGEHSRLFAHYGCGVSMFGKAARLRQAMRTCAVSPSDAIYIGDEIRDGEAADAAGVRFGGVTWGMHDESALRGTRPAMLFHHVSDIPRLLTMRQSA